MAVDIFTNNGSTTVAASASAPAAGTTESWTVASSSSFPAASNTANPTTQFRISDPAASSEIILVTNVAGTTWSVTRGVEGTTPVTHAAGFTVKNIVTAAYLTTQGQRNVVSVRDFGAVGDVRTVVDGAMTSGSATLTSATAGFTSADVGKKVMVANATSSSFTQHTFIASVTNGTTAVLKHAARATQTNQSLTINGGQTPAGRSVADCATTNDSTTITSATAAFTSADVGKRVTLTGAGRASLNTTIASFTNSTTVVLSANATRTCSSSNTWYGTDDHDAFKNAFAYCGSSPTTISVPAGMYFCSSTNSSTNACQIQSNTTIRGDGWSTIIRDPGTSGTLSREIWGVNLGSGGSSDPSTNISGVLIENIHFQGTTLEEGFLENSQNILSLNAVSDVLIRYCKFSNSRSDGIYLGSGTNGGTERHNQRIRIENCDFDGVNGDNRNGISIIDGEDVTVDRCTFRNICRADMPGAIDVEPNPTNNYGITTEIRITNCNFSQVGGNVGAINAYIWFPQETFTKKTFQGLIVAHNVFEDLLSSTICFGVYQLQSVFETTPRNDIEFVNNYVRRSYEPFEFDGVRGVKIEGNTFDQSEYPCWMGYRNGVRDVEIRNNTFYQISQTDSRVIEIANGARVRVEGNNFINVGPSAGGGELLRLDNGASLFTPTFTLTPSSTGGTLAAGTKSYRVAAKKNANTTLASTAVTTSTSGSTSKVTLTINNIPGATSFDIYGRTSGSELFIANVVATNALTQDYIDTGSVTPSGAVPGADTSNRGITQDIRFQGNYVAQGATNSISTGSTTVANHTTTAATDEWTGNTYPDIPIGSFNDTTSVVWARATATTAVGTSVTDISGLSCTLNRGTWKIMGYVPVVNVGSPTSLTATVSRTGGPSTSAVDYNIIRMSNVNTAAPATEFKTAFNSASNGTAPVMDLCLIEGTVVVTAAGSYSVAMTRTGGTSSTTQIGAYLKAERIA